MPVFNLAVPQQVTSVPTDVLMPVNTWADPEGYDQTMRHLAGLFQTNFTKYADGGGHITPEQAHTILLAGPSSSE